MKGINFIRCQKIDADLSANHRYLSANRVKDLSCLHFSLFSEAAKVTSANIYSIEIESFNLVQPIVLSGNHLFKKGNNDGNTDNWLSIMETLSAGGNVKDGTLALNNELCLQNGKGPLENPQHHFDRG
ncbi:unnamed protein product [Urochloa humidicola]